MCKGWVFAFTYAEKAFNDIEVTMKRIVCVDLSGPNVNAAKNLRATYINQRYPVSYLEAVFSNPAIRNINLEGDDVTLKIEIPLEVAPWRQRSTRPHAIIILLDLDDCSLEDLKKYFEHVISKRLEAYILLAKIKSEDPAKRNFFHSEIDNFLKKNPQITYTVFDPKNVDDVNRLFEQAARLSLEKRPKEINDQRPNAAATGAAAAAAARSSQPGAAAAAQSGEFSEPAHAAAETGTPVYLNFLSSPILKLDGNETDPNKDAVLSPQNLPLKNMGLGAMRIANLFKTNEENLGIKNETDDAGCIVYHDGLPIYIAADGALRCCQAENVRNIATQVIPGIIVKYISELSETASDNDIGRRNILEKIFKEIHARVSEEYFDAANNASFVFSAAITYQEKSGATKLICFGNGDVTVALRRTNGNISVEKPAQRLVHNDTSSRQFLNRYNVDDTIPVPLGHHKQFLPVERISTLDDIAKQIFCSNAVAVQPGDKVILATDALLDTAPCKIKKKTTINDAMLVDLEPADLSIFDGNPEHILSTCKSNRDKQFELLSQPVNSDGSPTQYQQQYAQANDLVNRFTPDRARGGDDFLCVVGIVPNSWQRKLIKHHVEHHTSLKDAHGKIKTMYINEVLGIKNNLQLTPVQKIQELHTLLISAKDNYYLRSEMGFFGKGFFSNTGNTKSYQAVVGEIKEATKKILEGVAVNFNDEFSQDVLKAAKEILSTQRSRVQFFAGTKSLDDADADLKILQDKITGNLRPRGI